MEKELLTITAAARYCGVSRQTMQRWLRRGYIKTILIGRRHWISRRWLDRWLALPNQEGMRNG